MRRWLRRLLGLCPNCGERLIQSAKLGKSLVYLDCLGCGFYRHPDSGFEHFPRVLQ